MMIEPSHNAGFTVVELVVVVVLLGILSVYAVPRFVGVASFERSGFYQETVSAARYAHQLAVGRGCPVLIRFDTSGSKQGYTLATRPGCDSGNFTTIPNTHPVSSHKDKGINIETRPSGLHNATFDALGRASRNMTVSVNGRAFTILKETGYVNATS